MATPDPGGQTETLMPDEESVGLRLSLLMSPSQTEGERPPTREQDENSPRKDESEHYPSPKESPIQEEAEGCPNPTENRDPSDPAKESSPVPSQTGGDGSLGQGRKNTDDDGHQRKRKRHKSGSKRSKKANKKKKSTTRRDPLYRHDPALLRGPTVQEISSNPKVLSQYTPCLEQSPRDIDDDEDGDQDDGFTASIPAIPDPCDDRREGEPLPEPGTPEIAETPEPPESPARQRRRQRHQTPSPTPQPPLPGFLRIPLEIRDKIYREILVVKVPILVRDGWRRIYARKRPEIGIGVLCTSRQLYHEATRILYGENTFFYLLRDPPRQPPVVDVEGLSLNDSKDDDEEEEDDEEGEDGEEGEENREEDERAKEDEEIWSGELQHHEVEGRNDRINVGKFGSYFRHLTVEAERNRYSEVTLRAMAEAIQVFTTQPNGSSKTCAGGVKMNIHTFTIRVSPQYRPDDSFTFINFLEKSSPVVEAISSLSSQFVKIDLLTKYINGDRHPNVCRLTLDMRNRNFALFAARQKTGGGRGFWRQDFWRNDKLMMMQRENKRRSSIAALESLDGHALDKCRKHVVEEVIQMSLDELDELDDEEYDAIMNPQPADDDEQPVVYEEMVLGTG